MKSAYNATQVLSLWLLKVVSRWQQHNLITPEQKEAIAREFKVPFYHPNLMIRILLFIATLMALSGVTGLVFLLFADVGESGLFILSMLYGIASFVVLEIMFIKRNHYKSGVTEAILYHACGFTIVGVAGLYDFNNLYLTLLVCILVFTWAAIRYLDLVTTLAALLSFGYLLFYFCYEQGGIIQLIIPFVFMVVFSGGYLLSRQVKQHDSLWRDNLLVVEATSLLVVYLSTNYGVVRELSINLMEIEVLPGEDIPFAYVFYFLTAVMPIACLYFGIKLKDTVLLRISLVVLAATVFTFKYYFLTIDTEILITLAGVVLIGISVALMRYLKTDKHGFTRKPLLSKSAEGMNLEAFVISQTLGGNQTTNGETGGGGESGGGGATTSF